MRPGTDGRFDGMYDRHFRGVLAFCLRRSPIGDGYDAANEVFEIAWRRIDDVPDGEAAWPWLLVVARRVLYRRRRSERRFRNVVTRAGSMSTGQPADLETVVVQRAEIDTVLAAVSRLSSGDREVLFLAAWEGLSHREIAEIVGLSLSAVDQRIHRAKKRLAKQCRSVERTERLQRIVGGDAS